MGSREEAIKLILMLSLLDSSPKILMGPMMSSRSAPSKTKAPSCSWPDPSGILGKGPWAAVEVDIA